MPKVIIFAGAPEASSLNWSLPLHDSFTQPFSSLLRVDPSSRSLESLSTPSSAIPAWRSVPLQRAPLRTGFTQQTPSSDAPFPSFLHPQFSSQSQVSFRDEDIDDDVLSQFYEYSFSALDSLPPSHPMSLDGAEDSFESEYSVAPSLDPGISPFPTDLSELRPPTGNPNASTPVALLVGIISLVSKTVRTRFGERDIVEALVGDDTRSAFQLTLWLGAPGTVSVLSSSTAKLRVGDVILVQGVAVGTFRGRVYGQSVRSGMGTRVFLLFREFGDDGQLEGHYSWRDMMAKGDVHPQLGKTRRVRRWMRTLDMGAVDGRREEESYMPDDTME